MENHKKYDKQREKCNTNETSYIENKDLNDEQGIANKFNAFYVNIGPTLARNIPSGKCNPITYIKKGITNSIWYILHTFASFIIEAFHTFSVSTQSNTPALWINSVKRLQLPMTGPPAVCVPRRFTFSSISFRAWYVVNSRHVLSYSLQCSLIVLSKFAPLQLVYPNGFGINTPVKLSTIQCNLIISILVLQVRWMYKSAWYSSEPVLYLM